MSSQTIFQFGNAKLRCRDIDPLYTALVNARPNLTISELRRFTLAEVAFDHAGLAAQITESGTEGFWRSMQKAAAGGVRGAPRRYYRAAVVERSLAQLQKLYGDGAQAVACLAGSFKQAEAVVLSWYGWGPTAAFKLCDMAERVCGAPIDFTRLKVEDLCSSEQVTKGLDRARQVTKFTREEMFAKLQRYEWATRATPLYDRAINIQELETICCYYSHDPDKSKHLPGMDALGIHRELEGYGTLARTLQDALPKEGGYICSSK